MFSKLANLYIVVQETGRQGIARIDASNGRTREEELFEDQASMLSVSSKEQGSVDISTAITLFVCGIGIVSILAVAATLVLPLLANTEIAQGLAVFSELAR